VKKGKKGIQEKAAPAEKISRKRPAEKKKWEWESAKSFTNERNKRWGVRLGKKGGTQGNGH